MDIPNAFIGRRDLPATTEISEVLGAAAPLWNELIAWFAAKMSIVDQEWKSSGVKYGWSLKLKLKKRTIVYLSPCAGCFRVAFVLGDRAVAAAGKSDLSKDLLKTLENAPHYPEGTGLRLLIKARRDLAGVRKLAAIKLAN